MRTSTITTAVLFSALAIAACAGDDSGGDSAAPTTAEDMDAETPTSEGMSAEALTETDVADQPGEEIGVVELSEPVTWSESGYELVVDAVRIVGVDELEKDSGQEISEFLEDPNIPTLVGFRATLRNTTDAPVDWYAGGIETVVILDGQQGNSTYLSDLGDTIRGGAESTFNFYYESNVPVEEARAAGEVRWDVGDPVDTETFETLAEVGELSISYSY